VAVVTVSVAVPLIPFREAVTVAEPAATPVATPLEFIVATDGVPEVQVAVAVTLPLDPSLYVAVALNCCVAPVEMLGLTGDTAMDFTVRIAAATLRVAVP
jgi:hypothetical protein